MPMSEKTDLGVCFYDEPKTGQLFLNPPRQCFQQIHLNFFPHVLYQVFGSTDHVFTH